VASSSSATRRFCGRRSFHSQHAPARPPKKAGRRSTLPRNCFPRRKCCTRAATATTERPFPVVCPWQAMSPSDDQPVASDPVSPRTDRVSAGRAFEVLRGPTRGEPRPHWRRTTIRTPHRVVEPTSTTIRRRHTDLSEDRCRCVSQQETKTPSRGSMPFSGIRYIGRYALVDITSGFMPVLWTGRPRAYTCI
jgi:hypothetical protein